MFGNAPVDASTFRTNKKATQYIFRVVLGGLSLIGDATVVMWAKSTSLVYRDIGFTLFTLETAEACEEESDDEGTAKLVKAIIRKASRGEKVQLPDNLDPNTEFYVLGLSPNAARISVRFFVRNHFGTFMKRLLQYYEELAFEKQYKKDLDEIPAWRILAETVSTKSTDKKLSSLLSGAMMWSLMSGTPYPSALLTAIMIRIRAEHNINYVKAAAIKAYLCRNIPKYKEELTMTLNVNSTNKAYILGRLFAVLEKMQQDANPGINTTIKDRYFTSACATPARVFLVLLKLAMNRIAKAQYGALDEKKITEIMKRLEVDDRPFPQVLSIEEQGIFV